MNSWSAATPCRLRLRETAELTPVPLTEVDDIEIRMNPSPVRPPFLEARKLKTRKQPGSELALLLHRPRDTVLGIALHLASASLHEDDAWRRDGPDERPLQIRLL